MKYVVVYGCVCSYAGYVEEKTIEPLFFFYLAVYDSSKVGEVF